MLSGAVSVKPSGGGVWGHTLPGKGIAANSNHWLKKKHHVEGSRVVNADFYRILQENNGSGTNGKLTGSPRHWRGVF